MRTHVQRWLGLVWISALVGCTSNVVRDHQAEHTPTMVDIYRQHQSGLDHRLAQLRAQAPPSSKSSQAADLKTAPALPSLPAQWPNPVLPLYVYEHLAYTANDEALVIPAYATAFTFYRHAPFALAHERF
jgi:conjugative transfer region lipoprotein (TIGR03751 family)